MNELRRTCVYDVCNCSVEEAASAEKNGPVSTKRARFKERNYENVPRQSGTAAIERRDERHRQDQIRYEGHRHREREEPLRRSRRIRLR